MTDLITCPRCGHGIELQAAMTAHMREHLLKEIEGDVRTKEDALAKREHSLQQKELQLTTARRNLDTDVQARLTAELARVRKEAEQTSRSAVAHEVEELKAELGATRGKLDAANAAELTFRKERRQFEEQKLELELAVSRKLDEEREAIREQARQQIAEQHRFRDADREKLIGDLRGQIDDMKRRAEFGLPLAHGETLEMELENSLRRHFPCDTIEAIPHATNGADVLQRVCDKNGLPCGTILWESKRTKNWNDTWLPKLRDDQRRSKSDLAAVLTMELPKNVSNFGCIDGTWVTNRGCFIGLATALRIGLIEAARAGETAQGKMSKVDLVFQYFAGAEFRQKVEGLVEAFVAMKRDLDSEKRSLRRIWNKREKQIERAMGNTASLYGDLGFIIGPSLPSIPQLELDTIAKANRPADERSDIMELEQVGI